MNNQDLIVKIPDKEYFKLYNYIHDHVKKKHDLEKIKSIKRDGALDICLD